MESAKKIKLPEAKQHLQEALNQYRSVPSELGFLTVAKTFEILVEYAWRELKERVEDQGLDAPAPKIAVKQAARLGLITEPEMWLNCIDARNDSVHDYFGISKKEYLALAEQFLSLVDAIKIVS
ncbi:MAG: hypothetical protein A3H42_03510 [Deltaproteobacteria bacterium RIFCSPLOWO2_02_FULL_46_8]|nr:MAG: hypothetical protein A3H42_03510 [Deltaproteobacteria bacterium RIFCSPLOWO2_02_FULL_46_8]